MKVTIITPSYNQGKYLERTIVSVLEQKIDNLEYLVMDGGSTDDSVEILKKYGEFLTWKSEKDKGQTDAVNKGLRLASGDIIGWLNSDDIYYEDAIKKVLNVFEENPEINVVYGNANHIREDDSIIEPYYTEDFNYERLKEICFICQPSVFFRKTLVDKYGTLDESLQYCMDYEYWLRLGKEESFFYLDELIAGSRLYGDNKTLGARRKVHEEILQMQKKVLGRASSKWIYNLAHVIVDEKGIPRQLEDGNINPEFAHRLAKESVRIFIKQCRYVPATEWKTIYAWKRL